MGNRIGLFIDGGFFHHLWESTFDRTGMRISLSAVKSHLELRMEGVVTEAHYVRGRKCARGPIDVLLDSAGIVRHDVHIRNGREVGADVKLALLALDAAVRESVDIAFLMTVDGDMEPLVRALEEKGVRAYVPDINVHDTKRDPKDTSERLATSALLRDAARTVSWADMVRHTWSCPEEVPILTQETRSAGTSRRGVICYVNPGKGFAFIEDTDGGRWYASADPRPHEPRSVGLSVGTRVRFSGSPHPPPGASYPRAYSLTPDE